ncbi:MAG: dTDP-4-dehydrorhamnose 3,5-epimerase [Nonlabens sp.]
MKFHKTKIQDCYLIEPQVFKDDRGFFMESYSQKKFEEGTGLKVSFVQDNVSQSSYGVVRGLHAQRGNSAQAKLVSVLAGEVLDVVVDARKNSPTYKKVVAKRLDSKNKHQLFVPKGCFHGFAVLSEEVTFFYKCDAFYDRDADFGIAHDDPQFDIDWIVPVEERILSAKDQNLPLFNQL